MTASPTALIDDPFSVLAFLAGTVAAVFQIARVPALAPLFERLPALVWSYFLPMLATTAGILPAESTVYRTLARYLLPACLVLLLLAAELRAIARLGRTAIAIMLAGAAGVALGALVAFGLLHGLLPDEAWKAFGALTGTWIGGSANLVAVATTLGLSPEVQGVIIIVDTVVGYSWMGVLIWLAGRQRAFDHWNGADAGKLAEVARRLETRGGARRAPSVAEATLLVGLAVALSALCLAAGRALPPLGKVLNEFSWAIVLVTTVALLLSLTPLARLEEAGASTLGYAGFYLLLASVGAQGDLRKLAAHPLFVFAGVIVILVHAAVLLAAIRLMRAPLFFLGAASQACVGGYASAPIVAAIYHPAMAPVGLLLAVLGNVLGTYAGLLLAQTLSSFGP